MTELIQTAWLKPPRQIGGLDHLGVQAPCIQIYSQLLPGITNVTDRARYYSFYPWLVSMFEEQGWRSEEDMLRMLRRSECLLTMISLQHDYVCNDGTDDHRAAMVGSNALAHAITCINSGGNIKLSDYAHNENSERRYFKNPVGGLGQYYFGALWGLGLLDGDSPRSMRLPNKIGKALADIVNRHVPSNKFIETISTDSVSKKTLEDLSAFCPCALSSANEEAEALIGVMLKGWAALNSDEVVSADVAETNFSRSHSLAYLCILADNAAESKIPFEMLNFRGMSYTKYSSNKKRINLPESLSKKTSQWQVYQRNELLSIALQGLFFSLLRGAEISNKRFYSTEELSRWFWMESIGAEVLQSFKLPGRNANDWLMSIAGRLPDFIDWRHDSHEIQCMSRVNHVTNKKGLNHAELIEVVKDSLSILASIVCRNENSGGYDSITFPEGYLTYYPVNIDSVSDDWSSHLAGLSAAEALSIFTQNKCLDTHLRIAMRKLSQQGENTFRFEPSEIGLVIKTIPRAANTTPRFKQAIRIIQDLGLLSQENHLLRTTERGKSFVEAAT